MCIKLTYPTKAGTLNESVKKMVLLSPYLKYS